MTARLASSPLTARRRSWPSFGRRAPPRTKSFHVSSRSLPWSGSSFSAALASHTALTRWKSAGFRRMSSRWAAIIGATFLWIACRASLVSAEVRFEKTLPAFSRSRPEASSASMVFSNVGGAALPAIAFTSRSCCAMASSIAGRKCSVLIASKGGTPKGVVHSERKGLDGGSAADGGAAASGTARKKRATDRRAGMEEPPR